MSLRYSTGYRNGLLQGGSFRELFEEGVLRIYTGSQPASADTGATGTLLATITRAANTFSASVLSTRQNDWVAVTAGTATEVYTIAINGVTYAYTMIGGDDASAIARALAALVRKNNLVNCVASFRTTEKGVNIEARVAGESYSVAVSTTASVGTITATSGIANSRYNGLMFGSASLGIIGKESAYSWQGSAVIAGTAGWFRLSENTDVPANLSTSAIRIDGSVGTSGADLVVGSASFVENGLVTIDTANFTNPSS
jgi:hypothetical protein